MNKNEIIDFCLDNGNLSESELGQKLVNKLSKSTLPAYAHEEKDVQDACGLTHSALFSSDGQLAIPDVPEERTGKVSMVIEYMEETYHKRELAYLFVQTTKALSNMAKMLEILKQLR